MADLPESIAAGVTTGHVSDSDAVHKFVNSIARVDTAAPQTTIDAVPTRTDFSETLALRRLWLTAGFVITTPLLVARAMQRIEGSSEAQLVSNTTADSDVVKINTAGSSAQTMAVGLSRLSIKGTGTGSRGVYANFLEHLALIELNLIGHPGTALYLESTNALLRGVSFGYFRGVLGQPAAAVSVHVDKGGRFNRFQSFRARQGEVGFDLTDTDGDHISESYIESNTRGTAQTGIRNRTTDVGGARRGLRVTNTYFENNPLYSVDVDSHTFTVIDGGRSTGGTDETTKTWREQIKLNGGGIVRAFRGNGGTYLSAKRGVIKAEGCDGVVGRVDEVSFAGLMPPIDSTAHNLASKSCFDSDPTWAAGGSTPPVLSYDSAVRFLGRGSKKAVFSTGGSGGAYARANISNTDLTLVAGDDYYGAAAFKSDVAGECFRLRLVGAADGNIIEVLTDTVWQIVILSTVNVSVPGAYHLAWEMGAALAANTTIWTGAVACSTNSGIAFLNTEAAAIDPGQLAAQAVLVGQMGVFSSAASPEAVVTALPGSICLGGDGHLYRKSTGTGNTGWALVA